MPISLPYNFQNMDVSSFPDAKDSVGDKIGKTVSASYLDSNFEQLAKIMTVASSAPTTSYAGQLWLDTSTTPNALKVWNGSTWSGICFVVRKNTGANIGARPRLNFIEGYNINLTIADDATDNEIDITVNGKVTVRKNGGDNTGTRPRLNFIEGAGITLAVADSPTNDEITITISKIEDTYYATNGVCASLPTERWNNTQDYVKVKEFTIRKTGTYRTKFDLRTSDSDYEAYGQVFKNGSAYGTERSTTSTTYVTFSEDLSFTAGDKCQLYCRQRYYPGYIAYVCNFTLGATIFASEDID